MIKKIILRAFLGEITFSFLALHPFDQLDTFNQLDETETKLRGANLISCYLLKS